MTYARPQILWGDNFENILELGFFDNRVTMRRPWKNAERTQRGGGVEDSWMTGWDYELHGEVRWIPPYEISNPYICSGWAGGTGFQAFFDWARQANTFRYVPDRTVPMFYVDKCYLSEPWEDNGGDLESNGTRRVMIVIRNQLVDFSDAENGIMLAYDPGMDLSRPIVPSFARASLGSQRGKTIGIMSQPNVLRDRHYEGSLRTTLLEGGVGNVQLVSQPENFGAWSVNGTPIRTGGQVDPFGGLNAYLIEDNDAAGFEYIVSPGDIAFTDGTWAFGVFVKQGSQSVQWFRISGSVERHRVRVTWTAGVPSLSTIAGSGTLFAPVNFGNGWWWCAATAVGIVGAETNTFQMGPGSDDASSDVGTSYFFGANAWNNALPSSYQGPSSFTRSSDNLNWSHPYTPQATFWYTKHVERGTASIDSRAWSVGSNYGVQGMLGMATLGGAGYAVFHRGLSGGDVSSGLSGIPAFGDVVELLAIVNSNGSVQLRKSINGAADVVGSLSAATSFAAAWVDPTFFLGRGTGANDGRAAFAKVRVGPLTFSGRTVDTIAKARLV